MKIQSTNKHLMVWSIIEKEENAAISSMVDAIGEVFHAQRARSIEANISLTLAWHFVLDRAIDRHRMAIVEAERLKKALEMHHVRLSEQLTVHRKQRAVEAQVAWKAKRMTLMRMVSVGNGVKSWYMV